MVFVDPSCWGQQIGRALMIGLDELAPDRGWTHLSLWTRVSNERARRLYEGVGYRATTDEKELRPGDLIVRYQHDL